jgi:Tol biopolymer transport system component
MAYPVTEMSWSPDGQSLAFEGRGDGGTDIFVTLDEGETIENITKTQEPDEGSPNWSPDGTRIAYAVLSSMEDTKIMVSSPDGTETEQILQDVFEPIEFAWSNQEWRAYSAFVSTRDSRYQIRVLNSDSSLYWLTPLDESKMLFSAANAAFSPDSTLLIYTGGWLNNTSIYLADLRT